ncbi:MAG: hypothetical protein IIB45_08635 [Candidatus Marinimicrobia bacterium]|nr:hypothetical protein [Candidatus Neomarinimicrobiota bacterium]
MINPGEAEHDALIKKIEETFKLSLNLNSSQIDQFDDLIEDITKKAQGILKSEWDKIKTIS